MKHIYADDIIDLQMNMTSVRFTLVQRNTEGGFSEVGRVILPAVSAKEVFDAMANGLTNAAKSLKHRAQKAQESREGE
jgi:hypothetical protein